MCIQNRKNTFSNFLSSLQMMKEAALTVNYLISLSKTQTGSSAIAELPGGLGADAETLVCGGHGPGTVRVHSLDGKTDMFNLNHAKLNTMRIRIIKNLIRIQIRLIRTLKYVSCSDFLKSNFGSTIRLIF